MDGYELVRRLRQIPALERSLLVALTGYGRDEDKQEALAAGFHHHLVKPIDLDSLQALIGIPAPRAIDPTLH
jgi:two-component system CheB/CheR fusion protein